jgi:DNA-binding response OmpR family regulator
MSEANKGSESAFKRLKIISTEDDKVIRLILSELVSPEGHEIQFARSSDDLFGLLSKHGCDVLILDVNVPGMNGYQIAREVCDRHKEKKPKILIFTGRDTDAEKGLALVSGADAVLKKGCPLELLLETINQLGGNKKGPAAQAAPAAVAVDADMMRRISELEKSLGQLSAQTAEVAARLDKFSAA